MIWSVSKTEMGNNKCDRSIGFHLHSSQIQFHGGGGGGGKRQARSIPKGCFAVTVGQGDELRRFVIPVAYLNHPLFVELLKEAEEKYGFEQKGTINIPCHVEEFCYVRGLIDEETSSHHHNHHYRFLCFKA